jgi:hypothetical protein
MLEILEWMVQATDVTGRPETWLNAVLGEASCQCCLVCLLLETL